LFSTYFKILEILQFSFQTKRH